MQEGPGDDAAERMSRVVIETRGQQLLMILGATLGMAPSNLRLVMPNPELLLTREASQSRYKPATPRLRRGFPGRSSRLFLQIEVR